MVQLHCIAPINYICPNKCYLVKVDIDKYGSNNNKYISG